MQKRSAVLLVDANAGNLSELERLLCSLSADLVCARSVEQALQLAQKHNFCAAVVNPELPGTGGWDRITQLRSLPVILLYPSYPSEAEFRKGYGSGAVDVLCRPIIPETLISKIRMYIANSARRPHHKDAEALFTWLSHSMEQIARAMASSLDMVEVPNLILEQLPEVVPYERGSILLSEGKALRIVAERGFPPNWPVTDARIPIRQGDVFQQIVQTGQALLVDDVMKTPAWQQVEGLPVNHSWLGVPLLSKDRVIGMVSLTRREPAAFRPEEVALIQASASQAAVALINAGLLNDLQRFNEQLEQLVQKRTEELKQAYAKLEKIDQTKTAFISVAAHELRTPLTLIKGYASLLSTTVQENKDASDLVDGIVTGERRLLEIINSMVDVSKIDNQALDVHKSLTSIVLIAKIIRSEFEPALKARRIQCSIQDMEQLPPIEADTELLSKLFRHLIGNAIKFTPDGGTVTISGKLVSAGGSGRGEAVEILIRDTGIGIDPAHQELIFEKFYQMNSIELHSSGKTKFKGGGPGLGLSISRGIVRAHGGRIWAESPGCDERTCPGSCFHIVLPVT